MHQILEVASQFIIDLISSLGYLGIYIGMFIESASIPLPSEIIMGFAGYLVYKGTLNLWLAALVGAIGNISGSTSMYIFGIKGGRPVIDKYGKYFHLTPEKMKKVDNYFAKWGDEMVFIAQLMPGVRTFISLPAGVLKINFPKFILYTFTGAFIWCFALAFAAMKLGENWHIISTYMKEIQVGIAVVGVLAIVYFLYKWHRRRQVAK